MASNEGRHRGPRSQGLALVLSVIAMALAASALVITLTYAGPTGGTGPASPPGTNTTDLWAAIHSNGSLARGTGVSSTQHPGTGLYEVTFDRDVSACSYQVTVGSLTPGTYVEAGFASVSPGSDSNGTGDTVYVRTANVGGAWTDYDFFIAVFC